MFTQCQGPVITDNWHGVSAKSHSFVLWGHCCECKAALSFPLGGRSSQKIMALSQHCPLTLPTKIQGKREKHMESFCKHIQGWRVFLSTWHKQKSSFRCSLRSFSHPCACCLEPADERGAPAPLLCLSLPLQTLSNTHSFPLGLLHLKTSMED